MLMRHTLGLIRLASTPNISECLGIRLFIRGIGNVWKS